MSINEAREYVDTVIESLVDMGIITPERYGRITVDQQQAIAEKITSDLYVDFNGGFVRKEPLYYLYTKRTPDEENAAHGDWVFCGDRGWRDSADKDCPEPEKLTEKQLRWLYLMLPVSGNYYTAPAQD